MDPGFGISTAWAYGNLTLPLTPGDRMPSIMASVARRDVTCALDLAFNRLEDVVLPRYSRLAELKAVLIEAGAKPALLSGSGACLFGLADSRERAERVAARAAAAGARPLVCRTLAANPILAAGADEGPEPGPGRRVTGRPDSREGRAPS